MSINDNISFIDNLVEDFDSVQKNILDKEPTTAQNLSVHLTKILILTCTSYYENKLQDAYTDYAEKESAKYGDKPHGFSNDKRDKSMYQKFSFGKIKNPEDMSQLPEVKNMLEPLKFFGDKFRDKIYYEIIADENKEQQLKSFQELFVIRNLIAHQTFVEFNSNKIRNKSFKDIKELHENAIKFVEYLITQFS